MEEDEKQRLADLKPDVDQHVLITELKTKILVLETALEASDAQVRPTQTIGFPPSLAISNLTPNQRRLQKFPYSMTKEDGNRTWIITFLIIVAINLCQYHFISQILFQDTSSLHTIILTILFLIFEHYFVFGMNVYPFVYACVLRGKQGYWPTLAQVWTNQKAQEVERAMGNARSPVTGLASLVMTLPLYTYLGLIVSAYYRIWFGDRIRQGSAV